MIFALIAYAVAMTVANLLVATFGPSISPINAFFLYWTRPDVKGLASYSS